jgi:hypothetical protein
MLPVLGILYVAVPSKWDFSPHVLTHSMPYFLVGASDWGVGNIYAFTKLAFWIGLVLGALANTGCAHPADLGLMRSVVWRLRQNLWHVAAAPVLATCLVPFMQYHGDAHETWLLTAYLFAGIIIVLTIHSFGQIQSWATRMRMIGALFVAIAWGFVRVSMEHP